MADSRLPLPCGGESLGLGVSRCLTPHGWVVVKRGLERADAETAWSQVRLEAKILRIVNERAPSLSPRLLEHREDEATLVLEWAPGPTLDIAAMEHARDPRWVVGIMAEVARRVDAIHRLGVLHLDLKPANIVIRDGAVPVLIDFGISRMSSEEASDPLPDGAIVGTPHYMAPEQFRGERLGPRTDIYALGATLFELLTGDAPYDGKSWEELRSRVCLPGEVPAPSARGARVPAEVDRICRRAMAKAPDDRFSTAGELARALSQAFSFGVRIRRWTERLFGLGQMRRAA